MRTIEDRNGRSWDVVVGRESWGAFLALFIPEGGEGGVRQAVLDSVDHAGASRELEVMEPEALQELLERSRPKEAS